MRLYEWLLISFLLIFSLTQSGCASFNRKLKSMLGGGANTTAEQPKPTSNVTKFSESADVSPRVKRQYKRATKESLADESALDSKAGSLWVMEGQGAYLFSQNVVRLVGDPLADVRRVAVLAGETDPKQALSQLLADPWIKDAAKYKVGDEVEGKITRITPFGAFVQVTSAIEALVHISELSDSHVEDPSTLVKLGETKKFRIIAIDPESHKLSLSLKSPKKSDDAPKKSTDKADKADKE